MNFNVVNGFKLVEFCKFIFDETFRLHHTIQKTNTKDQHSEQRDN